ncbi:MAG: glucose-6-phosphate isomerase 1 [marine bacterium B5-7]|nr:MAG: glucose-6-phosphate isomerase 1 [marine bacterium B5-7]
MSPSNDKQLIHAQLSAHYAAMKNIHLRDLFMHDSQRGKTYTQQLPALYIDYSKNILTNETLSLLFEYATASKVEESIKAMFAGDKINMTEDRAVLHTALRSTIEQKLEIDNEDIIEKIHFELNRIKKFVNNIHNKSYRGWTNKPITTFVNIGIGGSDLGPKMVVDALNEYQRNETRTFFISNIDYQTIESLQNTIDPETTLFIISSKSFNTIETRTNAKTLKTWMLQIGCDDLSKHFIAVSNNLDAAKEFGVNDENIFELWDWVGGRFSLWSSIGLPIALSIGFDNFEALLAGAHSMDEHFSKTPIEKNIPIILALIDYWYSNFFGAETHAFIPYDESLKLFPDYLSQLFMESNGKSLDINGHRVDYKTMPIVWGATGTNSQHSFFQLLHQGTHFVPIDFLVPLSKRGDKKHHAQLLANCLAQSQALMQGENNSDPNKHFSGNKPSTTILYSELTPKTLGSLIAMYEHRTFVQGLLWNINSFDQYGVELGKKLATGIYKNMEGTKITEELDSSTQNLINLYKQSSP